MSDQKTNLQSIGRVVAGVVDVQQTMALQFDSLSKGLEALKLENQSGISQLREEIRRSDDRSQKQFADMNALHNKELERLHQLIHTLLSRDNLMMNPHAAPAIPAHVQQQQQMLMMQRQFDFAQAQAQAQAQQQAMAQLLNAAGANGLPRPAVPVQLPTAPAQLPTAPAQLPTAPAQLPTAPAQLPTAPAQIRPLVPSVPVTSLPKPTEVTIPSTKPASETTKPAVGTTTPASTGFTFGGATSSTSIFGTKPTVSSTTTHDVTKPSKEDDDEENVEEYEPEGEFKPVVPLPDLVEVKTGEEGEQAVFNNRAKLYIYANETKEWKERGVGDLKVLYNKDNKSWRVVMRRDQVLKVCANFPIVSSMSIQQMASNEKAYTWFCEDFSEDEPAHVKLSARFANVEIANEFKTLFEKAVAEHKKFSSGTIDKEIKSAEIKKEVKKEVKEEVVIPANEDKGFGDKFKPKPGSWECTGCYVTCKAEETTCACCGTNKDGTTGEKTIFSKPSILQPAPGTAKVTFGFGASATPKEPTTQASQFGASLNGSPSANSSIFGGGTPKGTSIFGGGTSNTPKFSFNSGASSTSTANASTPTFNFNKTAAAPATSTSQGNSLFGTGSSKTDSTSTSLFNKTAESAAIPKPLFSFGKQQTAPTSSPAQKNETKPAETVKNVFGSGFTAGGPSFASLAQGNTSIFDSSNTQKAQQELAAQKKTSVFGSNTNTPNTTLAAEDEDTTEGGEGEYEPEVDFKPVIPLPDLVDVKTGEEDEEVVFVARCKLFKYHADIKENKERGVGDIKVLKSKDNKYRVVMRREQVHKLCANFRIEKTMKLSPKPNLPNVLSFMCQDYSEDPSNVDNSIFTVKFKEEATATSFKKSIQDAQATM